ncbi:MAG: DUF124 domain-containing protein, partial [uncultured Nocardioidaceae bacterium]
DVRAGQQQGGQGGRLAGGAGAGAAGVDARLLGPGRLPAGRRAGTGRRRHGRRGVRGRVEPDDGHRGSGRGPLRLPGPARHGAAAERRDAHGGGRPAAGTRREPADRCRAHRPGRRPCGGPGCGDRSGGVHDEGERPRVGGPAVARRVHPAAGERRAGQCRPAGLRRPRRRPAGRAVGEGRLPRRRGTRLRRGLPAQGERARDGLRPGVRAEVL